MMPRWLTFSLTFTHLDVEAKKELKRALQEYKGTLLLVSHEPDFYEDLVDTVWNIESWSTKIV